MCKHIAIMLFILCNGLTLLYFDDPNADAKVKVAFVLLSMMNFPMHEHTLLARLKASK